MLEMVQILTKVTNALGTSRQRKLQRLRMLIEAYKYLPRLTETHRDVFLEILRKSDFQLHV